MGFNLCSFLILAYLTAILRLVPIASRLDGSSGSRFVRSMITDQFKLVPLDPCLSDSDCEVGTYCFSCLDGSSGSRCVRSMITDQFKLVNNSMPFNKYAYLTTHNSYAIVGEPSHTGVPRITFTNQEDTVTQQLNNGVRALMLDTYDFQDDVWLCHSAEGKCNDFTAFEPAIDTLKEIEAFLSANPSEIITLILEDYVHTPNGLNNVFNRSGLLKFWFPLSKMPQNGQDWPLVSDMVSNNQRLLVFTSIRSKQDIEGIAYQWNFMVENQYGDDGMKAGNCSNRAESSPLTDTSKSLVLQQHVGTILKNSLTCFILAMGQQAIGGQTLLLSISTRGAKEEEPSKLLTCLMEGFYVDVTMFTLVLLDLPLEHVLLHKKQVKQLQKMEDRHL
ncbi:hypothetical protein IEQ34_001985 [Dendrobium chrysotoxum]|uniref:Uncharacterized protein n=1 Tax=Dendrobium chrysotoxum TaxID=161865 RepID=A0AAV7HMP0_DENCH|nr:hypothetical protein IEQ34_001985 [Dendrobium chrysotoxum]